MLSWNTLCEVGQPENSFLPVREPRMECTHKQKMIEITEKQLKLNEKLYLDRVENGEPILLSKEDGSKVIMVPQNPEDMRHLWDHDDGA